MFSSVSWVSHCTKLLSEQQMARKDAVTCQAVVTVLNNQPDLVSPLKLDVDAATGCEVASVPGGERVQEQVSITHQVHTGRLHVDEAVELELINTWVHTSEDPRVDAVATLSVVDDVTELNGSSVPGEVVAQSH